MSFFLAWLSRRSLRLLHALGAWLGWLAYALSPSYRTRLKNNARLAGVTVADRRAAVADAGRLVMELPRLGLRPRLAVRVNPDVELKGSGMKMGGRPSPFGVDADRAAALTRRVIADGAERGQVNRPGRVERELVDAERLLDHEARDRHQHELPARTQLVEKHPPHVGHPPLLLAVPAI